MGQASITVDILAKVKGWQEELAKLKSAAAKVDIGSDLGKGLERSIKDLETRVTSMSRNVTRQLTSDSGIDSFTDKVNNIDLAFQNLGNRLASVSFEHLNPEYVTEALKELNTQLTEATAALDYQKQLDFSQAVESATALKTALTRLGEDPATVSFKEVPEILKAGIESAKTTIDEATTKLGELNAKLAETKVQSIDIGKTPILAVNDLHAKIQEIVGQQSDYGFGALNTEAINQWIINLRALLLAAGEDLSDNSSAINQALQKIADSKTKEEVQQNLVALKTLISKEGKINVTDVGLGAGDLKATINSFIHNDLAKLDEAKVALESKLRAMKIPQEVTDKIIPNFTKAISQGKWEEGLKGIEEQLEQYKQTILDKVKEIEQAKQSLESEINSTKSVRGKAEYTQNVAQRALDTEYPALIQELRTKNAELEERVASLEKQLQEKAGDLVNKTADSGSSISNTAQQQLQDNAAAAKMYKDELAQVQAREQMIGKIQGVVQRWFSIYAAVRMVSNAIKSVIATIKELDTTITEIAIVTKMDQNQLWGQMETYTNMATKYAASISGVYKVSQLYYQQGLQTADVMALTEQTLKMARISGLDYADATDYMTNAVRSFKMEMTEAQTVVDVYSAVAASSATNVTELATAMSKTASSANAVGASFQNTTAMMAVMIEATRESAENIGSALKSIISRYGELKENKTGIDGEGEEYSLNKVDTALQTVGLSIHDAAGEFRDFDDVIMELAEKWNTIDKNTQRYIATVMAGNRQQSRFLALVSSYDRLKELSEEAADSENAAQLQFLKTLNSVDAKTQQLKTSLQSLYVDSGIENMYKGLLDWANNLATTLTNLPKLADIPVTAIVKLGTTFASLANVVTTIFGLIKARVQANIKAISGDVTAQNSQTVSASNQAYNQDTENYAAAARRRVEIERQTQEQIRSLKEGNVVDPNLITSGGTTGDSNTPRGRVKGVTKGWAIAGLITSMVSLAVSSITDSLDERTQDNRTKKAWGTGISSTLQGVGLGASVGGGWGALIGGVLGAAKGAIEAIGIATETTKEQIANLNAVIEETSNKHMIDEAALKTLTDYKKKYEELEKTKDLSPEDHDAWIQLNAEIASTYPQLLSYIDEEGNEIVSLGDKYDKLVESKKRAYEASWLKDIQSHIDAYSNMNYVLRDQVTATSNIVTTSRPWDMLGLGKANVTDNEAAQAEAVEQWLTHVNDWITQANGDKELFKKLFKQNTGWDWDIFNEETEALYFGNSRLGKLIGQPNITVKGDLLEGVKTYFEMVDTEFEYYTSTLDDYIKSSLTEMTGYFGQGMDFTQYGVLSDQVATRLNEQWQQDLAEARVPENIAFKQFYAKVPQYIEQFNQDLIDSDAFIDEDTLEEANNIFVNTKDYSVEFLASLRNMEDGIGKILSPEQIEAISDEVGEIGTRIQTKLASIVLDAKNKGIINEGDYEWFEDLPEDFFELDFMREIPIKYWESYVTQIKDIINSSSYNPGDKKGAIETVLGLRDQITGSYNLSTKDQQSVDMAIAEADFTTITGILDLQQKLSDMGIDVDFDELINTIIPNFDLEYKALEERITKNIKDLESALSKAQKGMNLEEAVELADKIGTSIDDFELVDGKFYYKNVDDIKTAYYSGMEAIEDALVQRQTELIENTTAIFEKGSTTRWNKGSQQLEYDINTLITEAGFDNLTRDEKIKRFVHAGGMDEHEADQIVSLYEQYAAAWKESGEASFTDYVLTQLGERKDGISQAMKDYIEYQTNSFLIQSGRITEFFENLIGEGFDASAYASNVMNGEWGQLPEEAQQYIGLLYNFVKDAEKSVFDATIKSMKGEGPQLITVTAANRDLLTELLDPDEILQEGQKVLVDLTRENVAAVKDAIAESNMTTVQKAQAYSEVHAIEYPDITEGFESVFTNGEIAYDAAAEFVKMLGREGEDVGEVMEAYGFTFNSLTGKWKADETALNNVRRELDELRARDDLNEQEKERLDELEQIADEVDNQTARDQVDAVKDVLKNYKEVSSKMIFNLSQYLPGTYKEIQEEYFTINDNGTYSLDIDKIQDLLDSGIVEVGSAVYDELLELVADIQNDVLEAITNAGDYAVKGTTSLEDMQKFATAFNEGLEESERKTVDELFEYDSITKIFKLNPQLLYQYAQRKREELKKLNMTDEEINDYINDYTENLMASNVDITGFLKAGDKSEGSKAWKSFREQLRSWATNRWFGYDPAESTLNSWMNTIRHGGEEAVKLARTIKGDELTDDEITTIYNTAIDHIKTAIEQLESKEGQIVDEHAAKVLEAVGYTVSDLGNGKFVIEHLPEGGMGEALTNAYLALYTEMRDRTTATVSDLNSAYAKVLASAEYDQSRPIEAIQNAMSMNYDALGEILAQQGIMLETVMSNTQWYGIEQIGAGKIRINDFTKFADRMGWDTNTDEYISAYKQYNDSLIEYNKHISDEIKNEFNNLLAAKPGEQINLTRLVSQYGDDINNAIAGFGATLQNEILTLGKNADIPAIAASLGNFVSQSGGMLQREVEAALDNLAKQDSVDLATAYKAMIENWNSISMETINQFAKGLGIGYENVKEMLRLTSNDDGTYKIDLAALQGIVTLGQKVVSKEVYNQMVELVAGVQDQIVSSISNANKFVINGTSNMADMQKFVNELNTLTRSSLSIGDAFEYDSLLNTFKLNATTLKTYTEAQKAELLKLGLEEQLVNQYIYDQTTELLQTNININEFLNATSTSTKSIAATKLGQSIKDWYNAQGTDITDTEIEIILRTLDAGGATAVAKLKEIKGTNVSTDELEAAYNASINRLRTAAEDLTKNVGETVSGQSIAIMLAAGYELESLEDGTAVIKAVGNMVEAYAALYEAMEANAEHTTDDLNQTFAKMLTAADQSRIDALETLQNASGVTYEAFATLLSQYNIKFKDVLSNSTDWGITTDGFGNIQITSWDDFVKQMNANGAGWDPDSPAYAEAYNNWVDARVEMANMPAQIVQQATEQLSNIAEVKPGQAVNVSYLQKAMGGKLEEWVKNYGKEYGVSLDQGLLLLEDTIDIPSLITAIANEAAAAGAVIPEELAKLADAIAEMLSKITSLITGGISGSLSNEDAFALQKWVDDNDLHMSLQFMQTKEGLQLASDQAIILVNKMRELDALQGEIAFNALKDNLIETDDRFKSVSTSAAEVAKLESEITRQQRGIAIGKSNGKVDMFDQMNGNVDLYNRPRIEYGDGSYSTLLTTTYDSRNFETDIPFVMNLTPIPPDASTVEDIMSDEELTEYIQGLLDQNPVNGTALLALDAVENGGKGLIINLKEASEITDEMAESMDEEAEVLHEVSEVYESIKAGEEFNSTKIEQYEKELALVKEIQMIRATSEDDSFNFMNQKIPGGQNNPLNYWENWAQAYNTIQDSIDGGKGKTGYMEYTDFYNLVTEMGNLASITGQAIPLGEQVLSNAEDAADLITQAAGALKVTSDGSLKVDLSGIGIDFATSAESMADGVDAGIHELAQSQVDMLDGLISLLETIVAMESLEDIDIEGNGIDLTDIFTIHVDENTGKTEITGFTEKYGTWRQSIIDQITEGNENFNKDLADAMNKITINGNSLAKMIQWDWSDFNPETAQAFSDTMAAVYAAAISNNYDLDNISESVKQVLIESGLTNLSIDIGDTTLLLTGGGVKQINWKSADSKSVMEKVRNAYTENKDKTDAEIHQIVIEVMNKSSNGETVTAEELEWVLEMNHHIQVKDGKTTIIWGNNTYTKEDALAAFNAAMVAWRLQDSGIEVPENFNPETSNGIIETTTTIGNHNNIKVKSDGTTIIYSSDEFPGEYSSQEAFLQNHYSWYQQQVKATSGDHEYHGPDYETWLFQNYKIRVKATTQVTGADGKAKDLSQDATARKAISDFLDNDKIVEMVQAGADGKGNYEVEIAPGITLKLSGEDIDVEGQPGTVDEAKLKSAVTGMLNIDQTMVDTIKLGVTAALTEIPDIKLNADTEAALTKINELKEAAKEITTNINTGNNAVAKDITFNKFSGTNNPVKQAIQVSSNAVATTIYSNVAKGARNPVKQAIQTASEAIGNVGLAIGNAFARGTLLGELGPELIVSNGRYFVAGQNGPEMMNLPDDAIVFNHLQTKALLEKGSSSGRGKAITNERNAVAYAKGNINGGPAMAGASSALAALKQLRSMWQSLLDATTKDLIQKAGGGGGGGGGDNGAFIKQLERWYDWLQEIAKLEEKINYEEQKRSTIASSFNKSGYEYVQSQRDSLKYLEKEIAIQKDLVKEQEAYFKKRQNQLNTQSAFSELYTFDEDGQIKYAQGKFAQLSEIFGSDSKTGKANHTIDEQYNYLISQGYGYAMQYDDSGKEIDTSDEAGKQAAIEAFWAKIEADQSEMQELHDSIEEHKQAILEAQEAQNEILKEIEDNQLAVEQKVLNAIEDAAKREIEELKDQKDALKESNERLINGLSDQLTLERSMYDTQQSEAELESKRRKLAILQRSGGSASEISSLQAEIDSDTRQAYFDKQQEQIDAIQTASDNQIEKLEQQIDLMTESLDYQKEHGLLWAQVYDVMSRSPQEITEFIQSHDSSYWGQSPAEFARNMREDLFEAEKWKAFAAEGVDIKDYVAKIAGEVTSEREKEEAEKNKKAAASTGGSSSGSGGSSSSSGGGEGGTQTPTSPASNKSGKSKSYSVTVNGNTKTFTDLKAAQQYYNNAVGGYASSFIQSNSMLVGPGKKYKDYAALNAAATAYATGAKGIVKKSGFKEGGMVTDTGLAIVHGSKAKPEAVLNAEQTKILRDNILGNNSNSLINLLKSYNEAYSGLSSATYDSISDNSNNVIIEHAEVNMHVAKMDSSYDAAKAGDDVMREILRIASKTSVRNRIQ